MNTFLRCATAVVTTAAAVLLAPGSAQADSFVLTGTSSYSGTFFSAPAQIAVSVDGGQSDVDLATGSTVRAQLATVVANLGQNPGLGGCATYGTYVDGAPVDVAVSYGSTSLTFRFGVQVGWVCGSQAQLDIDLPAGQTMDVGNGRTLTVTPHNYDPYASGHPARISVQWPENSTLRAPVQFDLALGAPADTTAPQVVPTIAGTLGAHGWYRSPVALTWAVTDAESAISSRTGCVDQTLEAGQPMTDYSCTATSAGGSTGPVTARIGVDLADPTVTCPASSFLLHQPGAVVTAGVSDTGSGPVATSVSAPADTSTVGSRSVTLTGRDNAGRTTTVQCGYSVGYGWTGFFAPVDPGLNTAKAGQAIPLKWRVTDAAGAPVTTLTSVSLTAATLACAAGTTGDQVEEYAAGGSGLQNLGDGYYQLNWKTPAGYATSCRTARLDLGDGVLHTADFAFRR